MAKKPEKKKPSRNVLVVGETIKKNVGRGKNKTTVTETKPARKALGTRLYCVLEPGSEKRGKKARFACYGSYEDAAVAMLSRAPVKKGAFSPAALKAMEELESRKPGGAFSAQALAEMEKSMKGLRGRHALPARGLRGTPEEHRQRAQSYKRMGDFLEMARETAEASGDGFAARLLDQTRRRVRGIRSENTAWAEGDVAMGPLAPWENMTSQTANLLLEYGPSEEVENIRQEFQAARRAGLV